MLRDAWLARLAIDPVAARRIAQDWWAQSYPTFKRLALYAATHESVIDGDQWVDWLLADGAWWLWSVETQRETMRLLVLRGAHLPENPRTRLDAGILAGPPRTMFRDGLEAERWAELVDHSVWLHLAKLASGGAVFGGEAQNRLNALSTANPQWKVAQHESDEFAHWMSGTGDPGFKEWRQFERAPRQRRDLVVWLRRPPSTDPWHRNDWGEVCREKFATAACALYVLSAESEWPAERWREALQAWSEEKHVRRSWRYIAKTVQRMPDEQLQSIAHSATWWLEAAAKVCEDHEAVFLGLSRRFLAMDHHDGMENERPVTGAINHPIGHVTQALLHRWFRREPADDQGLPDDLKPIFTILCDADVEKYRHARVLLAAHAIALFRVDRDWTAQYLLPLFDWQRSAVEARGAWEGFLWSPRLYGPLLAAFKPAFLETARHYTELGEHARQYAAFLTYAALDPADNFTSTELYEATSLLPKEGLLEASQALVHALEGAADQRESYWPNRIQPYWQRIWPKSRAFASKAIAEQLARLAIAAGKQFPNALATVRDWLQPVQHAHYVVHQLDESGLCTRFPLEALTLLDVIINDQSWPPSELGKCLGGIKAAEPGLEGDSRFRRLMEYLRRYGQN